MAAKSTGSKSAGNKRSSTAPKKRSGTAAQTKKPTGTKSSGSTKSAQTRSKQTQSTAAKKQAAQPRPMNNQFWSVILFFIGVLVMLLAFIPGERVWLALHKGLLGIFGVGVFIVPLVLGYTGILIGMSRNRDASKRGLWGILLTMCFSAFIQLFFNQLPSSDSRVSELTNFMVKLKELWAQGINMKGGGLISGLIVIPLDLAFGEIGAKILVVMFIVVLFLLLTQRSIVEVFKLLASPFVWIGRGIRNLADAGMEEDDYGDDPAEYAEDEPENEPEGMPERRPEPTYREEPAAEDPDSVFPKFERGRTRKRKAAEKQNRAEKELAEEVSFMLDAKEEQRALYSNIDGAELDIPISSNLPETADNSLVSAGQSGVSGYNMTLEEEAQLAAMVADAARSAESNRLPWAEDDAADPDAEAGNSLADLGDFPDNNELFQEEQTIPYVQPPLTLLHRADNSANDADKSAELREKGKLLVDTLASFGVTVRIVGIRRGPSVTRYEIEPAAGVKISKITALQNDIGLHLGGTSVRIAQVEGKAAVGVEVPNNTKDTVSLREILESPEFQESQSRLTFAVGKDIDGNIILGDIAKMPHMIIAGTTGSGKSVCTNSIIMSILFHASPEEVRMVLIDPKIVEFQPYDGIPHLLIPVVTNPQKAAGALNWAVLEMEQRYSLCAQYGVRDLKGYNALAEKNPEIKKKPQILIIIDEFADLMMSSGKEVEAAVVRIAQKARAAGIHLVIATQRPTVDVITGLIKANVPSRIAMSVKDGQNSRIILDQQGAETLLGNGDMLFYPNGAREPRRVQGCFTSDTEVESVARFLKQNGSAEYDGDILDEVERNIPTAKGEKSGTDDEIGELTGDEAILVKAAEFAVDAGQLSTTWLQRKLKLGYAKAARIVDEMEERGIVGPSEGAKPRKVLMSPQELTEWKLRIAANGGHIDSTGL